VTGSPRLGPDLATGEFHSAVVLTVVGPSGAGKTTLIEVLVAKLRAFGRRVAAVKHDAHRLELDRAGKDSWRLRAAGADTVVLMGRDRSHDGSAPSPITTTSTPWSQPCPPRPTRC
jgi:ABC-type cobalamin/Fe3+-siderophores transport system ATPase subunit